MSSPQSSLFLKVFKKVSSGISTIFILKGVFFMVKVALLLTDVILESNVNAPNRLKAELQTQHQDSRRIGNEKFVNEARGDSRPTCRRRFFRVWHEPWPQVQIQAGLTDRSLLTRHWPFLGDAMLIGANLSPGVRGVWMGWPHGLVSPREPRMFSDGPAPRA